MAEQARRSIQCKCGAVEAVLRGEPILIAACFCDDCQEGSARIEALPGAPPVKEKDGSTAYALYRVDRFEVVAGEELLEGMVLKEGAPTDRVIASFCNTAMYLDYRKAHWVSIYRVRMGKDAPAIEMGIHTRFLPDFKAEDSSFPTYPTFPLRFIFKVMGARVAMVFRR